jgi:predicted DCC family thiol-disulfide oxidoreductase YuxK
MPSEFRGLPNSAGDQHKAQVLYDGQCAFCCRSVELLKRLDWLKRLAYVDIRDPQNLPAQAPPLERNRLLEEMHLLPADGSRVLHGFKAFRWIAWRLPLLWPAAPLLYLPGMAFMGQHAYLWVARHRFQLVPCHGGVCSIKNQHSEAKS